jgi:hypothetical protein
LVLKPTGQNSADETTLDFAALRPQEEADRLRGIRNAGGLEVGAVERFVDDPDVFSDGIWLV